MRLSEAIRLGAMLKPQGTGWLLLRGRSCALGAALDAIGKLVAAGPESEFLLSAVVEDHNKQYDVLRQAWPWIIEPATLPGMWDSYKTAILTMNDRWGFSREEIADKVEAWENALGITDGQEAYRGEPVPQSEGAPEPVVA